MNYPKTLYGHGAYMVVRNKREENDAIECGMFDPIKHDGPVVNDAPIFDKHEPMVDVASNNVTPMIVRKRRAK